MEAKSRLTLKELARHPWLNPEDAPLTPLQSSSVLGQNKTMASALKQTFYEATRSGFTLGDVSKAPLAKRRQHKRGLSPRDGTSVEKEVGVAEGERNGGSLFSSVGSTGSHDTNLSSEILTPVTTCTRPSKLDLNLSDL